MRRFLPRVLPGKKNHWGKFNMKGKKEDLGRSPKDAMYNANSERGKRNEHDFLRPNRFKSKEEMDPETLINK
jgi:hypothetical protein